MKIVIITGGSGYIGSAITAKLVESGLLVFNIDLEPPKYKSPNGEQTYIPQDISDCSVGAFCDGLQKLGRGNEFYALIHMAAWKDLPGSYNNPSEYYRNNLQSTINACEIANRLGCSTVIFSSSAAVYPDNVVGKVPETKSLEYNAAPSPYGKTKLWGETIVEDICNQYRLRPVNLRYQNPIGCIPDVTVDESESMFGNVINCLKQGKTFTIYGGDYNTLDGTPVRDYVDIHDIVSAHIFAMNNPYARGTYNVGTGKMTSCKEVCEMINKIDDNHFPYTIGPKREGDAPGSCADITKIQELGWEPKYTLVDSIKDILEASIL